MTQPYITEELRSDILACKGKLSLAVAAKRFGVSRRTVGRIYHGGESSTAKGASIEHLTHEVEELKSLVTQLLASQPRQRLRRNPDPTFDGKSHKSLANDYSSPYRDRPGVEIFRVHGVDVPVPSGWRSLCEEQWFLLSNPASPECSVYPYPQATKTKTKTELEKSPAKEIVFEDPYPGVVCTCQACSDWRLRIAFEDRMQRSFVHAVALLEAWRQR